MKFRDFEVEGIKYVYLSDFCKENQEIYTSWFKRLEKVNYLKQFLGKWVVEVDRLKVMVELQEAKKKKIEESKKFKSIQSKIKNNME